MKKLLVVISLLILITGCSNEVEIEIDNNLEDNKVAYLDIKDNLSKQEKFNTLEDIPCDVKVSIDRINEEEISYRIIMDNPKSNMHDIEALLIHNNFTEDIFPSIGIFDDKQSLLVNNEDVKGISLVGYIETIKEIEELDLELRLWLKYKDDNNEEKEVYYKVDDISTNNDK